MFIIDLLICLIMTLEDLEKENITIERFTILEDLDLEHIGDVKDSRVHAAFECAKANYKELRVHGNQADYDKENGLSVVVMSDRKYLVYNPGTEHADLLGEYFGTLRYKTIRSWINGVPNKGRIIHHIHLFKTLK